jgi:predicted nucleotidyltransferase
VTDLIEQHLAEISQLCRSFGVIRLYLFGSAATDRPGPASELDFVVEMADRQPTGDYAQRYLDFADELEHLLARRVDLVTEQSIRNPYLLGEILATRRLIYGPATEEAAV